MLTVNISELILTVISFFLLLFLLKKLLYGPLISFMDARQARIDAGLREERLAEEKLAQARDENQRRLDEARRDAEKLAEQGRAETRQSLAEAVRHADAGANAAAAQARDEAASRREAADRELGGRKAELSALLAERLLGGSL